MFSRKKPADIRETKLTTLIAQDVHVTGNVGFSGALRLDGQVHGNVTSQAGSQTLLMLSERSAITGNVHGDNVVVNGMIVGKQLSKAVRCFA
jgi:cytoskeletal protein CcmA (bactofilin family)